MKAAQVAVGRAQGGFVGGAQDFFRFGKFRRIHFQRTQFGAIELGGVNAERIVTFAADRRDDLRDGGGDRVTGRLRRALERGEALAGGEGFPGEEFHSDRLIILVLLLVLVISAWWRWDGENDWEYENENDFCYSIIFSIGSTRMLLAPAFLSDSMVSQKTASWQTA